MATNFPQGVTSSGVPVMPSIPLTTGTYFFVHSGTGADSNSGRDKQHPLATTQAAIAKCTAARGDVVLLMPGHAETVSATSINLSVSAVSVIGLGTGALRPAFTFNATGSTITGSAASCSVTNVHCVATVDNVASAVTLSTAKDFKLEGCTFIDTSASLHFVSILTTGATANATDGLIVKDNYWLGLATAPLAFVSILGNTDRLEVCGNFANMAATNDVGHFLTIAALVCLGARIHHNVLNVVGATNAATGVFLTGSSTTNTGMLHDNYVTSLDTSAALFFTLATGFAVQQNYQSGVVAGSGTLAPDADDPEG